jgi:hypothetical protein
LFQSRLQFSNVSSPTRKLFTILGSCVMNALFEIQLVQYLLSDVQNIL